MREAKTKHSIDTIFPILLILIFALSLMAVLVLSTNIYHGTQETTQENFNARTCYSYVLEKTRQNDSPGAMRIETYDGIKCIVFDSKSSPAAGQQVRQFKTYIYVYEGYLRELQAGVDVDFAPYTGRNIAPLKELQIEKIDGTSGMYNITFVPEKEDPYSLIVGERSAS